MNKLNTHIYDEYHARSMDSDMFTAEMYRHPQPLALRLYIIHYSCIVLLTRSCISPMGYLYYTLPGLLYLHQ